MGDKVFDYVNSILENKPPLEDVSDYDPFLTNRALSQHIDCILFANELNRFSTLGKDQQYAYYLNAIRKVKRRFAKWPKKRKDDVSKMLMEYYQVNLKKAEEYQSFLTEEQLKTIEDGMEKGG